LAAAAGCRIEKSPPIPGSRGAGPGCSAERGGRGAALLVRLAFPRGRRAGWLEIAAGPWVRMCPRQLPARVVFGTGAFYEFTPATPLAAEACLFWCARPAVIARLRVYRETEIASGLPPAPGTSWPGLPSLRRKDGARALAHGETTSIRAAISLYPAGSPAALSAGAQSAGPTMSWLSGLGRPCFGLFLGRRGRWAPGQSRPRPIPGVSPWRNPFSSCPLRTILSFV